MAEEKGDGKPVVAFLGPKASYTHQVSSTWSRCVVVGVNVRWLFNLIILLLLILEIWVYCFSHAIKLSIRIFSYVRNSPSHSTLISTIPARLPSITYPAHQIVPSRIHHADISSFVNRPRWKLFLQPTTLSTPAPP